MSDKNTKEVPKEWFALVKDNFARLKGSEYAQIVLTWMIEELERTDVTINIKEFSGDVRVSMVDWENQEIVFVDCDDHGHAITFSKIPDLKITVTYYNNANTETKVTNG